LLTRFAVYNILHANYHCVPRKHYTMFTVVAHSRRASELTKTNIGDSSTKIFHSLARVPIESAYATSY